MSLYPLDFRKRAAVAAGKGKSLFGVLPLAEDAALRFARISAGSPGRQKSGERMIAAHAISFGAAPVTSNTVDFQQYVADGLVPENWAENDDGSAR